MHHSLIVEQEDTMSVDFLVVNVAYNLYKLYEVLMCAGGRSCEGNNNRMPEDSQVRNVFTSLVCHQ